jgi:hypothetical protein
MREMRGDRERGGEERRRGGDRERGGRRRERDEQDETMSAVASERGK